MLSARLTTLDGAGAIDSPLQVGLLPALGVVTPRDGQRLLSISTGAARAPNQPGYADDCDHLAFNCGCMLEPETCTPCLVPTPAPDGYPIDSSRCPPNEFSDDPVYIFNQVVLELRLRVPTNARSFSFDNIFFTREYPGFPCSIFNDFFVVLQDPLPPLATSNNLALDKLGDPIGVNSSLLGVCEPREINGVVFDCPLGTDLLAGTGFDGASERCDFDGVSVPGASSGWLQTRSPVRPGEIITLRFALWDTSDAAVDSTVLLDHFRWSLEEPVVETTPIVLR